MACVGLRGALPLGLTGCGKGGSDGGSTAYQTNIAGLGADIDTVLLPILA